MSELSAAKALLRLGPNEEQEPLNLLNIMTTVDTNAGRVSPEAAAALSAPVARNLPVPPPLPASAPAAQNQPYFEGSCSLYLKEDEESLSPLHCFMRKYCVEVFSASNQDVQGKHGRKIEQYQVGIQCMHCKHRPYPLRGERAVCFPSSLKNIYHSIETWQRRHRYVVLKKRFVSLVRVDSMILTILGFFCVCLAWPAKICPSGSRSP